MKSGRLASQKFFPPSTAAPSKLVIFVVPPYSKSLARAVLKEPKIYFYDVGRIKNEIGARTENVVALSLLKKLHYGQDVLGERSQLYYVRDKEKREVDFLTFIDGKIHDLIEVKVAEDKLSSSLTYFTECLRPKYPVQVVLNLKKNLTAKGIPIVHLPLWLEKQA